MFDTSMGFTNTKNLEGGMLAWYVMQHGMDANAFNDLINHQSGLLGISGISADMEELLQQEKQNTNAALAIDIFCYQIKKFIGAYAAV